MILPQNTCVNILFFQICLSWFQGKFRTSMILKSFHVSITVGSSRYFERIPGSIFINLILPRAVLNSYKAAPDRIRIIIFSQNAYCSIQSTSGPHSEYFLYPHSYYSLFLIFANYGAYNLHECKDKDESARLILSIYLDPNLQYRNWMEF